MPIAVKPSGHFYLSYAIQKYFYLGLNVGSPHKFPKGVRFGESDIAEWLKKKQKESRGSFKIQM